MPKLNLIGAMLNAPLVAVDVASPDLLHAATMETIGKGWEAETVSSACGAEGLKLLASGDQAVLWPPRVSSLAGAMRRCKACHEATGRKRPRSEFRRVAR